MIKFFKINDKQYISSSSKFNLVDHHGYYQLLIGNKIPKWSSNFRTIRCAEDFLNSHDVSRVSEDNVPPSHADIEFIANMYGFEQESENKWNRQSNSRKYTIEFEPQTCAITVCNIAQPTNTHTFIKSDEAVDFLDRIIDSRVIKCNTVAEMKEIITAASKSPREIAKNLVRVKSSNVWAYAIDIKDRHDKTGTVYVQFKGKNGGPGDIYCYYDFPITLWRKWVTYPSKGSFLWRYVRNVFPYRKLTGDKKGKLRNAVN